MKLAVMTDIHGNFLAFEACLKEAFSQGVSTFVFLGDYIGDHPYPLKTLDRLYELREQYPCYFVRGNKEDYWLNRRAGVDCEWKDGNKSVGGMIYCYEQLREKDFLFFEGLKPSVLVQMEGCAPILACHGSPRSNREKLEQGSEKTMQILADCEEDLILCGHTHLQQVIECDGKRAINPGAVGVARNSDGKAQFLILEAVEGMWRPQFQDVSYDVEKQIEEIHTSGLFDRTPQWCRITEHLLRTGTVTHVKVLEEVLRVNAGRDPWFAMPDEEWEEVLNRMLV